LGLYPLHFLVETPTDRFSQGYLLSLELEFMKSSLERILLQNDDPKDQDIDQKSERLFQRCSQLIEKINQVPMEVKRGIPRSRDAI
jgi:hypothetical protein